MESADCLICGNGDSKILATYNEPDQYEVACGVSPNGYMRKWVQCNQCGFIYSLYSRDKGVFDELYQTVYRGAESPWRKEAGEELFQRIINLPDNESETRYRTRWIKDQIHRLCQNQIITMGTPPYQFLDVGGGSGVFAYEFRDKDWVPYVVDPDDRGSFMEKYNIKFIQGYYRPGLSPLKFDLVSLIYVLEHLDNPISLIHSLHDDMEPGALLYIEVPDAICFQRKESDDDIFNSCHLWMFDPHSLSELLHKEGFETVALQRTKTVRDYYGLMVLAVRR